MLAASRRWLKRNRTVFAVGAGVATATYVAGQYVISKLSDARQRMTEDRSARDNLRRRFEQNQQDCTFTVLAIVSTATNAICDALPVEETVGELQRQKARRTARSNGGSDAASSVVLSAPPSRTGDEDVQSRDGDDTSSRDGRPKLTKAQLWDKMKIQSIARAFTMLYTVALLSLLTRIQLNLLGRRNYLASVIELAAARPGSQPIRLDNLDDDDEDSDMSGRFGSDYGTVRSFLSFSWWLLNRGCLDLLAVVTDAVEDVFGPLSARDDISLLQLSDLTIAVRKKIEGASDKDRLAKKWLPFLLPPPDQEIVVLQEAKTADGSEPSSGSAISAMLRRLLDESADLIDFPAFSTVLTHLLDAGFTHLTHNKLAAGPFKQDGLVTDSDPATATAKLASCLAVYCRQAAVIGAGDSAGPAIGLSGLDSLVGQSGNEYVGAMESVPQLNAYAAVVYSSNFEAEIADPGFSPAAVDQSRTIATFRLDGTEGEPADCDTKDHYATAAIPNGPGIVSLGPVMSSPKPGERTLQAEPADAVDFDAVWAKSGSGSEDMRVEHVMEDVVVSPPAAVERSVSASEEQHSQPPAFLPLAVPQVLMPDESSGEAEGSTVKHSVSASLQTTETEGGLSVADNGSGSPLSLAGVPIDSAIPQIDGITGPNLPASKAETSSR